MLGVTVLAVLAIGLVSSADVCGPFPSPAGSYHGDMKLRSVVTHADSDASAQMALQTLTGLLDAGVDDMPRAVLTGHDVSDAMLHRLALVATVVEVDPLERGRPLIQFRALQLQRHVHEILYVAPGMVVANASAVRRMLYENFQWCVSSDALPQSNVLASRVRLASAMPDIAADYRRAASLLCPRASDTHAEQFRVYEASAPVGPAIVGFWVSHAHAAIRPACDKSAGGTLLKAASRGNFTVQELMRANAEPRGGLVVHAIDVDATLGNAVEAPQNPNPAPAHFSLPADEFAVELTFPGARFHYFWDDPHGRSRLAAAIAADVGTILNVHQGVAGVTQLRFSPGAAHFDVHFAGLVPLPFSADDAAGRLNHVPRPVWGRSIAVYKDVTGRSITDEPSTVPKAPTDSPAAPSGAPATVAPGAPTRTPVAPASPAPTNEVLARLIKSDRP
jgi:hypothetical protein